ncbi:MAG: TonB-dependent receptor [Bacteroidales bacterium]|nr:TonB-dependent receptor [Bacteroidales bacterium]MCL2132984.1 TonB-dependent receptor [Bacteroidales bacterium]
MKKRFLLLSLLLFCLCYNNIEAARRNTVRLQGIIIDKASATPLEFSTISLSDSTDKAIAVTISNEQGRFSLAAVAVGEYTLKVSYIGYTDITQPLKLTEEQGEIDLGEIAIEADAQQLAAVVVSSKRPSIERQIDKLVVNIANTIGADNSTAAELLKKAPGVSIDRDGNISLNGKAVQVWVDNRPTHLSGQDLLALLSATEGSTIDKIEIIDNPSSKYDASGSGGIINIKTKKNFMHGFNGNVRKGFRQYIEDVSGYYYGANAAINLNYRNDLISTFINYSIRRNEEYYSLSENVQSNNGYRRYSESLGKDDYTTQNIKTGIDFFINKKNTIGLIGNLSFRTEQEGGTGTAIVNESGKPQESSETIDDNPSSFLNGSLNLNYTHLFGNNDDHNLTANLDYIYYTTNPRQYSHTDFDHSASKIFDNNSEQKTQVFSSKLDYARPINKEMKMEAGGKIGYSHNDSEILRNDYKNDIWQKNDSLSNAFEYDEMVSALYVNYAWQINKQWSAKAGLRWENTYSKGNWKTSDSITTQNYNDFFPTLFVGYTPHEKHSFSLSYTRRLQRPNYWQLNPFKRYVGVFTYIQGNPELSPSYSDNINFSYTAFQVLNVGLSFSYNKGMIIQVPFFDLQSGESGYVQGNFGHNYYYGFWASVSELPLIKEVWNLSSGINGGYLTNNDNTTTTHSMHAFLYLNSSILFSKTWSIEIEGWAQSPAIWGYYDMKAQGAVSMGVKKNFCNNQGSVSLYLDDIFKTQHSYVTLSREGTVSYAESRWASRALRFSFSWRFGKMSSPAKQRNVGQQEEAERLGGK